MFRTPTYLVLATCLACACRVEPAPTASEPSSPLPVPVLEPPSPGAGATASTLPPAIEARRQAAIARLRAREVASAIGELEALEREAGPSYTLANDLAAAYGVARDWSRALAASDRALSLYRGLEAAANRVEALLQLGDRREASREAHALVQAFPKSATAHYARGATFLAVGAYDDARLAFESALDRDPDDLGAAIGVFACVAFDPEAPELDELGERLLQRSPEDPYVLYLFGAAKERREDSNAAKKLYRQAISAAEARGDSHPWAQWNLAELLEREIDLAAAKPHYEKFIATAPPSAKAYVDKAKKKLAPPEP